MQAQIINLLEDLKEQLRAHLLFIAHDLGVIKLVSDRIMVLYLGKVCEIAPTEALYDRPGHPYTRTLLASLPVPDPDAQLPAIPPMGEMPSRGQPSQRVPLPDPVPARNRAVRRGGAATS